jgi:hypothetical protein
MGIKTNLNQAPYYDDYDPLKDFYREIWKPGFSVQTRELNQLQSMTQAQIERFADNIFTRGSIVTGVNFQFMTPYAYVKLGDLALDGTTTDPASYVGCIAQDEGTGLEAYVVNYADGFEASDPDLKTLYVKYINSGTDGNTKAFTPGNNITIKEGTTGLWKVEVDNGGLGFGNNDTLVVTSALVVNVASGVYSNNDYLIDPATGANALIIEVDTTTLPGKSILKIAPRDADLTNSSVTSNAWNFNLYSTVTNQSNAVSAVIESAYGTGATGRIITNSIGNIREVVITNRGSGYTVLPHVTVKTSNSAASIASLELTPQNFVARLNIPAGGASVGNGYGFAVTDGVIYDVGHFLRVGSQTIIVDRYSETPNNVVVGFQTTEEIITVLDDASLYDNATGTPNENAPGADRLRLTPTLVVITKEAAAANSEFLPLVEWNDGNPYIQNKTSTYSRLGDTMAQQIYDQSGNFVLDAFQVTTDGVANASVDSHFYTVVVDPGQAYINGRKVQTLANYRVDLQKGVDTRVANNKISLNYGNYVRINEASGGWDASAGGTLNFYSAPRKFLSNTSVYTTAAITPVGRQLGTAKIRSVELESGLPGSNTAVYRLFMFDVRMNAGENFRNIRAVHYDESTYDAIADIVTEFSPSINANICELKETAYNSLLFSAGVESLKNSNGSTYVYRTTSTQNTATSTGRTTISVSAGGEYFPYGQDRSLSGAEMQEFVVTPANSSLIQTSALTGTVSINTTSTTIAGTSTDFLTAFKEGDYCYIESGGLNITRRVVAVPSSTSLTIDAVSSFANTTSTIKRVFPQNIPVPFGVRDGLSANVDSAGQAVTLQFAFSNGTAITFASPAQVATRVTYNVERRDVSSSLKTANRNKYVKIALANVELGTNGPWCVGVPDAFRLRAVYVGNSTVNASSTDITNNFYLDHNQNANYLNLGYLYKRPGSQYALSANDYLLVCFDYFTRDDAGYYDTRSYLRTADNTSIMAIDSAGFGDLSANSAASTWEIPEVYTYDDDYYDLTNQFDFRPACQATVTPNADPASAPVNPSATVTFSGLTKFPAPNSVMATQVEQYLGRIDDVYIGDSGHIYVLKGIPDVNPRKRLQSNHPKDSLRLQLLNIPPYPNMTTVGRNGKGQILATGMANEKFTKGRISVRTITPILSTTNLQTSQPMVYTMEDIANLERRIKDLEYYVGLSLLETTITNKIIPSSLDASLNRFKFGFFADDFSTDIYSDLQNPQYSASFESEGDLSWGTSGNPMDDNSATSANSNPTTTSISQPTKIIQKEITRVVPPKYNWSMKHYTENMYFVDDAILEQVNATQQYDPCTLAAANSSANNVADFAYYTAVNRRLSSYYSEGLPGLVTLYFQVYGSGARINVYNPNNEIVVSTDVGRNDLTKLTATDRLFLTTNSYANDFYNAITKTGLDVDWRASNNANYITGAGKFSYNSLNGGKYTIKAELVNGFDGQVKFLAKYPSVLSAQSRVINSPACDPNPPVYIGSMSAGALSLTQWSCSNQFRVNSTNYRAFVLQATGLKPNTEHRLYLDGEEWAHAISITQDLFDYSHRAAVNRHPNNKATGELLAGSNAYKFNQLTQFLQVSRSRLYNTDGSPTAYTRFKTNASGYMRILVFFPLELAGWFSQDFNASGYFESGSNTIANGAQKLKPTLGSSGYSTIELSDHNESRAVRVFAGRTPNKVIPTDPKGTI